MSAKIIVCFVAMLCVVEIVAQNKPCKSQRDCPPTHCCTKKIFKTDSYCVPRRKLNEVCIADEIAHTLTNGIYDITCPCEGVFKCIKEQFMAPNGEIYSMGNPRCREPTYAGQYPSTDNDPSTAYANNGNAASANSVAVS